MIFTEADLPPATDVSAEYVEYFGCDSFLEKKAANTAPNARHTMPIIVKA
jgi:hypothetical protein